MLAVAVFLTAVAAPRCSEHKVISTAPVWDYRVCSEVNDATGNISITLTVSTTGWVGFGIGEQTSGGMPGADMAVITETGLVDMYGVAKAAPVADCDGSGWGFESRTVSGGQVTIKMSKLKVAADKSQDRDVPSGDVLILLAYGAGAHLTYHGTMRTIARHSFYPATGQVTGNPAYDTVVDVRMPNFTVPSNTTTYGCYGIDIAPSIGATKYHAVRLAPLIRTGRGFQVHHIVVFACSSPQSPTFRFYNNRAQSHSTAECFIDLDCRAFLVYGWALGSGVLTLPANVGMPHGPGASNTKLIMEIHYDNPGRTAGQVDDSGVRLYLSRTLRAQEAGYFNIGDPYVMHRGTIPPSTNHLLKFDCGPSCTNRFTGNVNVMGSIFHMHKVGRRGAVEIFRNGTATTTLTSVDFWDNDMQRYVSGAGQGHTIQPGDTLRTVCQYYHTHANPVPFGVTTNQEMCMAFLLLYPLANTPGTVCGHGNDSNAFIFCGATTPAGRSLVTDARQLPERWGSCKAVPTPAPLAVTPTPRPTVVSSGGVVSAVFGWAPLVVAGLAVLLN